MSDRLLLAIDQGTTSTRALLFDRQGNIRGAARRELPQRYPRPGWVEHDPEHIWADTLATCREALAEAEIDAEEVEAIGITNQRETAVLWDRETGRPVYPAIVWQDRRTADLCRRWREEGWEADARARTGLVLDPYFSASKVAWMLEEVDGVRRAAERGGLAFGTVDSWLLWNLTGGRVHATDVTNASRTLLFDIHRQEWDEELLERFRVPAALLPQVRDSSVLFGETDPSLFGRKIPIAGVGGDQQAASFGQALFQPGMIKGTYGTGCFVLVNTGDRPVTSRHRLLTTIAWRIDGRTTYALEGSIFVAGAAVQWIRDELGLIREAAETEALARGIESTGGVYLVPGFVGLGAPHWDPDARGALLGLTRDTGPAEIARATLEAVAFQTRDLMGAMEADSATAPVTLRVDGGMVVNDWAMQFLADILDIPVERPEVTETTSFGAACLAGLQTGYFDGLDEVAETWRLERRFDPSMAPERREELYAGWRAAVRRVLSHPTS